MPLARLFLKPRPKPDGRRRPPLPVLLPLLIGATFVTGAAILAQPTIEFLTKAERAEARYIGAIGAAAHPRFRFTAADGSIVMFTARDGSAKGYRDGDRVRIAYDPAQPTDARLNGLTQWRGPLVLLAIGLVAMAGGAWLVRAWRQRQ